MPICFLHFKLKYYMLVTSYRNADDVHDLMDDITEQQEVSDEITNALATGIGQNDLDEVIFSSYAMLTLVLFL